MVIGVGCDIVQIARVHALITRHTTLHFLSEKEQLIFDGFRNEQRKAEWAAGRFAAKEAIYKAIHKVYPCALKEIEVLSDEQGAPYCDMVSFDIQISIAHEKEYAIAYAIASKE